ncbi:MAG: hypothetical protein J6U95_05920 [Alistipes sp.]|nr:hypothetical protein [Alistipes sp.]
MKKFWNLMLAALVIFGAVACTENQEENIPQEEQKAVLSFVANIANDETRTYMEQEGNVWKTKWNGDETLYVYNYEFSDDTFEFTNTKEYPEVFKCTQEGVLELIGKPVQIDNNLYGIDSTTGQAGAYLYGYQGEFNPTTTITLDVQCAFFHFTAAQDVTLTATKCIFGDKDIAQVGYVDTIEFPAGEHWVAFLPRECTFSYSVGGVTYQETTKKFEAKKIYNLGTLGKKSEYGVVGSFQAPTTWDVAAPVAMYEISGGWVVAKNVELYKSDEIKIVKGNSWDESYGLDAASVLTTDAEHTLKKNASGNIKVAKNGKFDIYFKADGTAFKYECVEEYAGLMVDITIDNKANWSPLYITLKDGDTVVADNATVTNNKYQVSGEYIGKTLTCTLSNGTKTSEVMNVAITKAGATVTLEETIIKLKVQLNTDNAKAWWGDTMKIHVWETGTSFDTSWPGNAMTSEGNYTWSIIVPSELVGKTIKYLVHNGNGWQSKDSTVTIKAEGNTVTGSSIGIN